jgi:hypothetical protein
MRLIFTRAPRVPHKHPACSTDYAKSHGTPNPMPRNTAAATSHSSDTATTPMNTDRTETATIAVGPWLPLGARGLRGAIEHVLH